MLEGEEFFPINNIRKLKIKSASERSTLQAICGIFQCPTPGCDESFDKHSELEIHLEVGHHKKINFPKAATANLREGRLHGSLQLTQQVQIII